MRLFNYLFIWLFKGTKPITFNGVKRLWFLCQELDQCLKMKWDNDRKMREFIAREELRGTTKNS